MITCDVPLYRPSTTLKSANTNTFPVQLINNVVNSYHFSLMCFGFTASDVFILKIISTLTPLSFSLQLKTIDLLSEFSDTKKAPMNHYQKR